jgi:hypothetical protein
MFCSPSAMPAGISVVAPLYYDAAPLEAGAHQRGAAPLEAGAHHRVATPRQCAGANQLSKAQHRVAAPWVVCE